MVEKVQGVENAELHPLSAARKSPIGTLSQRERAGWGVRRQPESRQGGRSEIGHGETPHPPTPAARAPPSPSGRGREAAPSNRAAARSALRRLVSDQVSKFFFPIGHRALPAAIFAARPRHCEGRRQSSPRLAYRGYSKYPWTRRGPFQGRIRKSIRERCAEHVNNDSPRLYIQIGNPDF